MNDGVARVLGQAVEGAQASLVLHHCLANRGIQVLQTTIVILHRRRESNAAEAGGLGAELLMERTAETRRK